MKKALLSLALLLGASAIPAYTFAAPAAAQATRAAVEFTAIPADGSITADEVGSISLTFTGAVAITDEFEDGFSATLDDKPFTYIQNFRASGNTLLLSLQRSHEITKGVFKLELAAGSLTIGGVPAGAISYSFTVGEVPVAPSTYTFEPENGSTVTELKTIVLKNSGIVAMSDADYDITLTNTTTNTVTNISYAQIDDQSGDVEFNLGKNGVTAPGEYTLLVPAGAFWVGSYGEDEVGNSPEYKASYTIAAPVLDTVDFAPLITRILPDEESADPDFKPESYWSEGAVFVKIDVKGSVDFNSANTLPIVMTLDGNEYASIPAHSSNYVSVDEDAGVTTITMVFKMLEGETPVAPGLYEMTIPAGYFNLGNKPLSDFSKSWKIAAGPTPYDFTFHPATGELDLTAEANSSYINSKGYWYIFDTAVGSLQRPEASVEATLTDSEGNVICKWDSFDTNSVQVNRGNYKFKIVGTGDYANGINVNGAYTLNLPEGFFIVGDAPTAAAQYTWNVTNGISSDARQIYTLSPEPGSYDVYPTIILTYENCTNIEVAAGATAKLALSGQEIGVFNITTNGTDRVVLTPTTEIRKQAPSEYSVYRLTIPAGVYKLTINGHTVDNDEIKLENTYKINVPKPKALLLSPAGGQTVKSVDELKYITFTTPETILINPAKKARLYEVVDGQRGSEPVASYSVTLYPAEEGVLGSAGEFAMVDEEAPALADGTYEFVIPSELYRVVIEGTARQNVEQTATYTIDANAVTPAITVTTNPEAGAAVSIDDIDDIFVFFNGASTVTVSAPATVESNGQSMTVNGFVSGSSVMYSFITEKPEAGEWTVTVPAGSVSCNGEAYDQEIKWSFTVTPKTASEVPAPVEVSPAEGQVAPAALKTVTISYAADVVLTAAEEGTEFVTLQKEGEMMMQSYSVAIEGNKAVLTLPETDEELQPGQYTLTVYNNSWLVNGQPVQMLTYTYTVTDGSVEGITADDIVNVYTIEGICVLRDASAAQLSDHPAGLYIVNGKKVIIRK